METATFENSIRLIDTDRIDARRLYSDTKCDGVQINLKPDGEIEKHTTEEDVIFYVLKGPVTATVGDETAEAETGTVIPCPSGVLKGLKNNGDTEVAVLVVKLK